MSEEQERWQKIESTLAHLEHQLDQLNQVVIDQGHEIRRLTVQLQRVTASMEGLEGERIRSTNAKPPHYQ